MTILVLLRAFASGSAALTGVEAIANGVNAFRRPQSRNAGRTLLVSAAIAAAANGAMAFLPSVRALGRSAIPPGSVADEPAPHVAAVA